jgi:predicted phage terminase large subunit-like protein
VLADLFDDQTVAEFETLPEHNRIAFIAHAKWIANAHAYQIPPDLHLDYRVFLMLAGRGAGKTRSAAEALWWWAWTHPETMSIVLAPTSGDLKFTCFEGPSGLLACIPEALVTDYNKQDHLIKLSNGSKIRGVSADSYDRLRGINSSFVWCDELAAFNYLGPNEAWDNMMLGLRIKPDDKPHSQPRVIVTTTPRPKDLILDLVGREGDDVVVSYDCAFSEKEHNDPTAMTTWGVFKPQDGPMSVLLIDCWAEHLSFPKLKPKVLEEWRVSYGEGRDAKRPDLILVEDKAAGISLIQELRYAHLPVRAYNPGRADKMQRLQITASIFATGRVWLPESDTHKGYVRSWAEGFLSQICAFPDAAHDDYVDSATQAIRLLKDMNWLDINPEPPDNDDDYLEFTQPKRVNPYSA